jgi:Leucine-rich repeat (LRR) protein
MNTIIFKKQDLKNIHNIKKENIKCFENEIIENLYNKYHNKEIIDYRIYECNQEEYFYLDLSNMKLDNTKLYSIFNDENVKILLNKIEMLDLSNNNIDKFPDYISNYSNIKYLNISNNNINGIIEVNNIIELECSNNIIEGILSISLNVLNCENNKINNIYCPNITILEINDNDIDELPILKNIEQLNVVNTKIQKIDYIKSLKELKCSTKIISKDYKIKNISFVNSIYYIEFI